MRSLSQCTLRYGRFNYVDSELLIAFDKSPNSSCIFFISHPGLYEPSEKKPNSNVWALSSNHFILRSSRENLSTWMMGAKWKIAGQKEKLAGIPPNRILSSG